MLSSLHSHVLSGYNLICQIRLSPKTSDNPVIQSVLPCSPFSPRISPGSLNPDHIGEVTEMVSLHSTVTYPCRCNMNGLLIAKTSRRYSGTLLGFRNALQNKSVPSVLTSSPILCLDCHGYFPVQTHVNVLRPGSQIHTSLTAVSGCRKRYDACGNSVFR